MPEEQLFKTEESLPREEIADELAAAAANLETGAVTLSDGTAEHVVDVPEEATFEVELERQTGTGTDGEYYELEFELSWTE